MGNKEDKKDVQKLLEGHGFLSRRNTFDFVTCFAIIELDGEMLTLPRILVNPKGRPGGDPFELFIFTSAQAADLGIRPVLLPQGDNRGEALAWMKQNTAGADELTEIAEAIHKHGTIYDSPIPCPVMSFPGGREALQKQLS